MGIEANKRLEYFAYNGGHIRNDLGLDGSLLFSYKVISSVSIFAGVDTNLEFKDRLEHATWGSPWCGSYVAQKCFGNH